jgi:hypothetical protein
LNLKAASERRLGSAEVTLPYNRDFLVPDDFSLGLFIALICHLHRSDKTARHNDMLLARQDFFDNTPSPILSPTF